MPSLRLPLLVLLMLASGCAHVRPASVTFEPTAALLPAGDGNGGRTIHELEGDTTRDLVLTGAAMAGTALLYRFDEKLGPSACRWCGRDAQGAVSLNRVDSFFRRRLIWCDPDAADAWSDRTLIATVAGTPALGALAASVDGAAGNWGKDTLVAVQSASFAVLLNTAVKLVAARERPFLHVRPVEREDCLPSPQPGAAPGNYLSFYSGHASAAFAAGVSAGAVASMRGYRLAPLVWGAGLAGATTTSYLRIAADRHYFSDVAVGAATGIAAGVLVPFLLHPRKSGNEQPAAAPRRAAMAFGLRLVW
jgi:membrane-associated phospholipid phosphatase